ncbi:N-acetylneuraminate lyase B-like isoform X1 [Drosophila albomicans]|uniref:N-acetylneuraminate lyase n=1 Tax=Drosophila albomicans TaxID=7291 RepID=A0A9C6SMP8_DROAB|nr:N-acetylneuraminate lyase B-like isoform X1 [Drosophila albomicans]
MAGFRRDTDKSDESTKTPFLQESTADDVKSSRTSDHASDPGERASPRPFAKDAQLLTCRFKGLLAPVFSCFKDDDSRRSLDVRPINRYAEWLKNQTIAGVVVNGVVGEGPMMRVRERKANAEYWHRAALRHNLLVLIQLGGAPLPDVLSLASHAEELHVSGVIVLPDLFYRPRTVDQLVGYCKHVASRCRTRPFLYYHLPAMTGVNLDMVEFCAKAERAIPNFMGLHYSSGDLEMGQRCLRLGRVILLGSTALLASGLMSGFSCCSLAVINIRPDLVRRICDAFDANELQRVRDTQRELNQLIEIHTQLSTNLEKWVSSMKSWLNKEFTSRANGPFGAGPARIVF